MRNKTTTSINNLTTLTARRSPAPLTSHDLIILSSVAYSNHVTERRRLFARSNSASGFGYDTVKFSIKYISFR